MVEKKQPRDVRISTAPTTPMPLVLPVFYQLLSAEGHSLDAEIRTGLTQDLSQKGLCLRVRHVPAHLALPEPADLGPNAAMRRRRLRRRRACRQNRQLLHRPVCRRLGGCGKNRPPAQRSGSRDRSFRRQFLRLGSSRCRQRSRLVQYQHPALADLLPNPRRTFLRVGRL